VTTQTRADGARGSGMPGRAEVWLVATALLATMVIPFLGKYQSGDVQESSPLVEALWIGFYCAAGLRLWQLKARARLLLARSLPLLGFLALMLASSLWSVEAATFKRAIELIGTSAIGYYIVARFTLVEMLDILVLTFGCAAVMSLAVIFGAPGHGRMDFGGGAWTGLFQEKNNLGAAMALAGLSLFVLLAERAPRVAPALAAVPQTPKPSVSRNPVALGGLALLLSPLTLFEALGRRRVVLLGTFALVLVLLAGSRSATSLGAYGAVSLMVVAAWACRSKRYGGIARILTILGVLLTAALLIGFGFTPSTLFDALGRDTNLTGRTDFWPYLQEAIADRPWLGYGYDAFFGSPVGKDYLSYYVVEAGGWTPYHAHNSFLQILLDSGYVGLVAFLLVLAVALVRSLVYAWKRPERSALWPAAILVYLFLGSFTETYFRSFNTIEWVVFVTALLYPLLPAPAPPKPREAAPRPDLTRDMRRRSWSGPQSVRDRAPLRETA
jgi:O-antigen ligase